jgi:hypothetical protein
VTVISLSGSTLRRSSARLGGDGLAQRPGTPVIGAYWLLPSRMARSSAATRNSGHGEVREALAEVHRAVLQRPAATSR